MGTADLTETRLVALQDDLAAAASTAERITVLEAMIELAAALTASGDPDRARMLLDQVLTGLHSAAADLPDGGDDYLIVLFMQAEASLLRDGDTGPVPDLDIGIECLRRLRAWLPADEPARVRVDARLAAALMTRMGRAGAQCADLDEAGTLLASLLDLMDADDPGRRRIISALALQRATRYAGYDGTVADRDAALNYAADVILPEADGGRGGESNAANSDPDEVDESAAGGHLVIAWMALTRQLTSAQRSATLRRADLTDAQLDGAPAAALLAALGTPEVSLADAETAIGHLRQIPAGTVSDGLGGLVPMLWGMALSVTLRAGGPADDVSRVADELRRAAAALPAGTSEPGELLAMRAAVLAAADAAGPGAAGLGTPVTDALNEAVARLPAGHPMRTAELGLLQHALGRQVSGTRTADDPVARLEEIVAVLDRMPSDPEAARAVATVGLQILGAGASHRSGLKQHRLVAQLERVIGRLAPDDPVRPFAQCMYWALESLRANMEHRRDLADSALAELISCADSAPADNPWRPHLLATVGFAFVDRHGMGGEMRHLDQADKYVCRAFQAIDPTGPYAEGTPGHGSLLFLRGHLGILRYYYDRDAERLSKALADLEQAVELVGPDNPASSFMISSIQTARTMQARLASPREGMFVGADEKVAFDAMLAAAEQVGRDHPDYPLLLAQGAGGFMLRGLAEHDLELVNRSIPALANACSVAGLANRERTRLLEGHGFALLTRYLLTGSQRDLSNAIDRLEEARRAVEQEPGSPYAASVLQRLASAYRMRGDHPRGDVDRAAAIGLAGLQELVRDVLLQDTDDNALYRARQGTNEATEMARWLLGCGRPAEAISALELGRGMVLHAASSGAGVETALRESGHVDLADEWATGAAGESDLRYRTMLALGQSPAQARLLSPPTVGDIAAALISTGADALVYLLPQDDDGQGIAVLVDRDAAVRILLLPGLKAGASSPVGEFLGVRRSAEEAMAAHDAAAQAAARPFWLAALGALCDWAWRVAVGRVLSALPARAGNPEPRIVLVPGGELGLVPWHAARRPGDGKYACQEAIISYSSSARQFVDAARRRPRPWAEEPVLISDSSISLYITAVGIAGLYADHYRKATVFGHARTWLDPAAPGAVAATPGDVLAALPHAGYPGASLLHVGCHGQVQVPVLNSSLLLGAGEDGGEIRIEVRDILRQARQWRSAPGDLVGDLVVLASCFSAVTETDYDEALTLTTAFLSAGATGVVGAAWMVGEAETAVFMTLFHHFLNDGHLSPACALRETQLWMLDSARDVPGLPDAIREEAAMTRESGVNPYARPEAWAGFSYQGR